MRVWAGTGAAFVRRGRVLRQRGQVGRNVSRNVARGTSFGPAGGGFDGHARRGDRRGRRGGERGRAVQSFNQLRTLTADDPQQQQRLAELEPLITSRIADIAELIEVRKARGLEAAARKIASGEGKQVMDRVRRVVSQMEQAETELLTERSTKAEAGARATIFILISGALLALAVVAIASVLLHRDIVERKRVEKERDHIWNLSRDLLCVAGFEGYFKSLNPAWEKTFGFSRAELQAKPYMEFVHPGDRTGTSAEAEKVATGAEVI